MSVDRPLTAESSTALRARRQANGAGAQGSRPSSRSGGRLCTLTAAPSSVTGTILRTTAAHPAHAVLHCTVCTAVASMASHHQPLGRRRRRGFWVMRRGKPAYRRSVAQRRMCGPPLTSYTVARPKLFLLRETGPDRTLHLRFLSFAMNRQVVSVTSSILTTSRPPDPHASALCVRREVGIVPCRLSCLGWSCLKLGRERKGFRLRILTGSPSQAHLRHSPQSHGNKHRVTPGATTYLYK